MRAAGGNSPESERAGEREGHEQRALWRMKCYYMRVGSFVRSAAGYLLATTEVLRCRVQLRRTLFCASGEVLWLLLGISVGANK